MWKIMGILTCIAFISYVEVYSLDKKKYKKELVIYFLFLSVGVTMVILLTLNIKIPSPTEPLLWLFSPIDEYIEKIL